MIFLPVLLFFCFVFPHFGVALLALTVVVFVIGLFAYHLDNILIGSYVIFGLIVVYETCVNFPGFVMSVLVATASLYLIHRHWSRINAAYHWAIDYDDDE